MSMGIGRRDLRKFTPLRQVDGPIVPGRQTWSLRHLEHSFYHPQNLPSSSFIWIHVSNKPSQLLLICSTPKWDHLRIRCIIQVVTCLMLIICQRWDVSTFAVWHFTTVVWCKPWKDLQWCLHQMMTHQSMYKLKSSSQAASGTTTCLTHQWKQRRPLQALLQLIPGWVKGRNILKRRKGKCLIELRHNPTACAFTIYFSDISIVRRHRLHLTHLSRRKIFLWKLPNWPM